MVDAGEFLKSQRPTAANLEVNGRVLLGLET